MPIYGTYQITKDVSNDKPTLIDKGLSLNWFSNAFYQGLSFSFAVAGIIYGLYKLTEKLF